MKLVLCCALLSLIPFCAPAQSTAGVNWQIVSASASGHYCMDADENKKADGTKVFMYPCNGRENQRWTVTTGANGGSAIVGTGGFCLDVREASKTSGTPVELYQCHFRQNQLYTVGADGTIKEEGSGKCLQASADKARAAIVLGACSGAATEKWKLEPSMSSR